MEAITSYLKLNRSCLERCLWGVKHDQDQKMSTSSAPQPIAWAAIRLSIVMCGMNNSLNSDFNDLDEAFYELEKTIDIKQAMLAFIREHPGAFHFR